MPERTVYIVQKVHWEYNDNWYDYSHQEPLRAYADREYAELMRDEAELQAVRGSLVRFVGGFKNATSHAPETIIEFLRSHSAPEPPLEGDAESAWSWHSTEWWQAVRARLDDADWIAFRNLFDRARFFTVVPLVLSEADPP